MTRKKLDPRIRALIDNGVKTRHRSLFMIVGDRARDQIVNIHYMLSKAAVKSRPSVLWCYKKDLGFVNGAQLQQQALKRKGKGGKGFGGGSGGKEDPFKAFITTTDIKYVYYSETHRVLGNTFGMLVLQDFEALTPNLLARTVETVEGGGSICILLKTMDSLRQLHALAMDVHKRFRTEGNTDEDPVARFNERFLLSLTTCESCLVVDDELNVLPISSHSRTIESIPGPIDTDLPDASDYQQDEANQTHQQNKMKSIVTGNEEPAELTELKESLKDVLPAGPLIKIATTIDQAKAALLFLDAIGEKSLRSTVSLTAARGRGKSAALGIAIAGAISAGYSNIFVTAPSPENLRTLFDFILRGFDSMGYVDHTDYDIIQSTNPDYGKAIVRINVFRAHRQTIQYIAPADSSRLGQAELVVIDEAAAIPLPLVQSLLGPYLVFLSSTVNGYEGTGRSLSLKLIQKLREQNSGNQKSTTTTTSSSRLLKEFTLEEPIRYAAGDDIEKWLNKLLCLDCSNVLPPVVSGCPHPSECQLFYVSRDTLFSFHKLSEEFLQRVMALFVSSHYKNSPNDLQLISDAPGHHLFVLLGPVTDSNAIPDVLAAVHLCMEGAISRESVMRSLGRGQRASGDLIPWTISQQFQDNDFPSLSGARVVRIATHPSMQSMGYGSRTLQLLEKYFSGEIQSLEEETTSEQGKAQGKDETKPNEDKTEDKTEEGGKSKLLTETIEPRKGLPPLLIPLQQRSPERLHWLGVAYGISRNLYGFWARNGYNPIYLRLTQNDITGEHSCIMLRKLHGGNAMGVVSVSEKWLDEFTADFRRRLTALLSYDFRKMHVALPTSILVPDPVAAAHEPGLATDTSKPQILKQEIDQLLSIYDRKRLESYASNLVDYHVILDTLPTLARLVFTGRIPLGFSAHQYATLVGVGLQHRLVEDVSKDLGIEVNQLLANFNKAIRKIASWLRKIAEREVENELALPPAEKAEAEAEEENEGIAQTLEEELDAAGGKALDRMGEGQERLARALGVSHFQISNTSALESSAARLREAVPSMLSIKVGPKRPRTKKEKKQQQKRSEHHSAKHQKKY